MPGTIKYSIIIPTCNRVPFLSQAILSAANAAPAGSEIIVVNDGDPFFAADLPTLDIPLHVTQNQGPSGASGARNHGVKQAQGDWIFFLDDDDRVLPGYWQHVADSILNHLPSDRLAYGFCTVNSFTDRNTPIPAFLKTPIHKKENPIGPSHLAGLSKGFWISLKSYLATGGLNTALKVNEDTDFCIALLKRKADCYVCKSPGVELFNGSVTGNQLSVTRSANAAARYTYFAQIIDNHATFLATTPKLSIWLHWRAFQYAARMSPRKWPTFGPASAAISTSDRSKLLLHFAFHAIVSSMRRNRNK